MSPLVAVGCALVAAGSARDAASATIEGRWAYLLRDVAALERPRPGSPTVALLATATPEGESNLVVVLERRRDGALTEWARVRLAHLPNGRTGWVPRAALGELHVVRTRLVIDRRALLARLYRNGRRSSSGRRSAWARPGIRRRPASSTCGTSCWIRRPLLRPGRVRDERTLGHSHRLARSGYIGIHGTDEPALIPGRVSHGCVRLRNDDVLRLAKLMPVGTPVTIR